MNTPEQSSAPSQDLRGCRPVAGRRLDLAGRLCAAVLVVLAGSASVAAQMALSEEDVVTMLRYTDGTPDVLAEARQAMIQERCVSFYFDDSAAARLRAAGADDRLISIIRSACYVGLRTPAGREMVENIWARAAEAFNREEYALAAPLFADVYIATTDDIRRSAAGNWGQALVMQGHLLVQENRDTESNILRTPALARQALLLFQDALPLLEESGDAAFEQMIDTAIQYIDLLDAVVRRDAG